MDMNFPCFTFLLQPLEWFFWRGAERKKGSLVCCLWSPEISFGESIIVLHSAHVFACRCKLQTFVKRALQWIHEYFLPSFSIFLIRNACPSQIPILSMFRKTLDGLRLRYQIISPPSSRSGSKTLIPNQSAKTFPWVRYLSTTSNSPSDVFGKSFGAV